MSDSEDAKKQPAPGSDGWDAPAEGRWEEEAWAEGAAVDDEAVFPEDPLADFFVGPDEMSSMRPVGLAAALIWGEDQEPSDADLLDHDYLSFFLADEEYAVPITALREIVRPLPVAEVPRTPPYVLGVITLRGSVLPVLDLRVRLGLPVSEPSRASRILVVETDEGPAGILADRVAEVVRIGDEPLEPPPGALGSGADYLEGIIRRDGRMLIVLDLERALEVETDGRRRSEREAAR